MAATLNDSDTKFQNKTNETQGSNNNGPTPYGNNAGSSTGFYSAKVGRSTTASSNPRNAARGQLQGSRLVINHIQTIIRNNNNTSSKDESFDEGTAAVEREGIHMLR